MRVFCHRIPLELSFCAWFLLYPTVKSLYVCLMRKITGTVLRHSLSKPYLESTLQYFLLAHWFTTNKKNLVKGKNLKFKIRFAISTLYD